MIKDRLIVVRDFAVRNSKLVFPVILIAAVATTVTLALRAGNEDALDPSLPLPEELSLAASPTPEPEADPKDTTMEMNTNGELYTLIATYYNAFATGDVETIRRRRRSESRRCLNMWRVIRILRFIPSRVPGRTLIWPMCISI